MVKMKLIDNNRLINRLIANKLIKNLFSYLIYHYLIFYFSLLYYLVVISINGSAAVFNYLFATVFYFLLLLTAFSDLVFNFCPLQLLVLYQH